MEFRRLTETDMQLWQQHEKSGAGFTGHALDGASAQAFRAVFMQRLLQDSLGFAGCEMVRRVLGLAKVAEIADIADPKARADAEMSCLRLAERLLVERHRIGTLQPVLDWVQA
jgi:5-methylthioribose kinase